MNSPNRSLLLYILLAILPLFVIDGGWVFLRLQDREGEYLDMEEQARQALESMEQNWSLQRQIALHATRLRQAMTSLPDTDDESGSERPQRLLNLAREVFAAPFPTPTVWMYSVDGASPDSPVQLLFARPENQYGKTGPAAFFRFLLRHQQQLSLSESEAKRGQALTEQYLGKGFPGQILARTQRGTPVPVVHARQFHWFVWDYIEVAGRPTTGFILLIPNHPNSQRCAFEVVRREPERDRQAQKGFIRFFRSEIPDILPTSLARSRTFLDWLNDWRREHDIFKLEQRSVPWGQPIGNRVFFFRIIPDCTHFGFISFPRQRFGSPPLFLLLGNGLFLFLGGLVLLRGLMFGTWPHLKLQGRFTGMYLFATALPFTLALVGCLVFLRERENTLMNQLQTRLLRDLRRIDQNKDLSRSRYVSTFHQAVQDPALTQRLKSHGLSDPSVYEVPLSHFHQARPALPLAALYLADWKGNLVGREFKPPEGTQDLTYLIRFYRAGLILLLRNNLQLVGRHDLASSAPPLDDLDNLLVTVHRQGSSVSIANVFQENRLLPDLHQVGSLDLTKLHELISIDGLYLYSLVIFWRNNDLDLEILREQRRQLLDSDRRLAMMAYRIRDDDLEPLFPESEAFQKFVRQLGRQAIKRRGSVQGFDAALGWQFVAVPTRNLKNIVLVSGTSLQPIVAEVARLQRGFVLLGIAAFGIILLLGWVTGKHIIEPITRVKHGVEAIVQGDFRARVALDRPDELGQLTQTFDAMITRLEERERLATLVSGKVLDAFSGESDLAAATRARRIEAVILVSDIRNFTSFSEQYSEKTMTALLNHHFDRMNEAIAEFGGRIDKFIGDAIHAIFESEESQSDTPENRSLRAAARMLEYLYHINEERQSQGLFGYRIGIGIAAGEVILGGLGDPEVFFDYTIIGPPLAEAEHLETLSKQVPHFPLVISPRVADRATLTSSFHPLSGYEELARVTDQAFRADH
ncbi:MAG TPA: adenylate/guanylate cyclase domain-containing protein [Candidatus Ozemobacteraceae bacterium]|nr:adenylate/guanylate cyclase domain-containing protein [Candidatus Ozemobacteraceae bacterium]